MKITIVSKGPWIVEMYDEVETNCVKKMLMPYGVI